VEGWFHTRSYTVWEPSCRIAGLGREEKGCRIGGGNVREESDKFGRHAGGGGMNQASGLKASRDKPVLNFGKKKRTIVLGANRKRAGDHTGTKVS